MRAVDPRLLRHARAARGYLVVAVLLGLVVTGLILAQAALPAHALATAARHQGHGSRRDPGAAARPDLLTSFGR
jgi:ATP-binding cassette subfamily C protein CydD